MLVYGGIYIEGYHNNFIIEVDNLFNYPLLEWEVFNEIEKLFNAKGPRVLKEDAMI